MEHGGDSGRRTVVGMSDVFYPAWIAGRPVTTGSTAEVFHPYDGSVVGAHVVPTADQVEEALAAAWAVRQEFAATSAALRADALMHVSHRITERAEEIARLITAENGKPLMWARAEASRAASTFRWASEEARRGLPREAESGYHRPMPAARCRLASLRAPPART